jgi:hypothetical protein
MRGVSWYFLDLHGEFVVTGVAEVRDFQFFEEYEIDGLEDCSLISCNVSIWCLRKVYT